MGKQLPNVQSKYTHPSYKNNNSTRNKRGRTSNPRRATHDKNFKSHSDSDLVHAVTQSENFDEFQNEDGTREFENLNPGENEAVRLIKSENYDDFPDANFSTEKSANRNDKLNRVHEGNPSVKPNGDVSDIKNKRRPQNSVNWSPVGDRRSSKNGDEIDQNDSAKRPRNPQDERNDIDPRQREIFNRGKSKSIQCKYIIVVIRGNSLTVRKPFTTITLFLKILGMAFIT